MKTPGSLFIELVVPAVIGLLGVIASLYGPTFSEKQKELSYVATGSLPAVNTFIANHDVKVMVGGVAVKNLRSYQVVLENTGKLPIDEADFKSPIEIVFPAHKIVGQPIVVTDPPGVAFTVETGKTNDLNSIFLSPKLLNENDKLRLSILLDGEAEPLPIVSARIMGVKAILQKNAEDTDVAYRLIYSPWYKKPLFLVAAALCSFAMGCFASIGCWKPFWVATGALLVPTVAVAVPVLMKLALPWWIGANHLAIGSLVLLLPTYVFGIFWGRKNLS